MRRLAPFVGIALAVAIGVTLAPYLWWIVLGTVAFCALCVAAALIRRGWRRVMAFARAHGAGLPNG